MTDLSRLSLKELAAFVSQHLREKGIDSVLTGGACVSIYTRNRYQSYDLDFVIVRDVPLKTIAEVLEKIGFRKKGRIFVHDRARYSVDILNPPLSIGEEKIDQVHSIDCRRGTLKLLSPTDSVKDRLAAFYFWNDLQALDQAVMICRNHDIDFKNIAKWSSKENEIEKFRLFLKKTGNRS